MDIDPLPSSSPFTALLLLAEKTLTIGAIEFHSPQSWLSWSLIIVIAIACLGISAFVSGSEIAYFSLTTSDIDKLGEDEDDPSSRRTFSLLRDSERLLATILIANNLVNITTVVLLSFAIGQVMEFHSAVVNFLLQSAFLTFLLLLCGEIFPKLVAKENPMRWALKASSGLTLMYNLFKPISTLMVRSTSRVNRMVTKKRESLSTDELSQALEISDVKAGKDKEMLEGILSFGEKEVSDIMISRVDVTAVEYHAHWDEVVSVILRTGYSRIPVYDTNQDTIKGILYSKDLLPYMNNTDPAFAWQRLLREAYFVPESRMIDDLLEDFRRKKIHIAVVVDEYGGTQGIVTLEDIIEEIVGEIDDEYDDDSKLYKRLGNDTYIFDAKVSLVDFCRITGVEEEDFGDIGEAETLAGLLLAIKGDFPTKKESLVAGRCRFLVLEMQRHRITSVRVKVMEEIQPDDSRKQKH